jgi:DNA-binding PadR family transcriptional regulator
MASESTTPNALLGLLALRSWTAYELTGQMRRALRWIWPRSEANLYSALKRLGASGLADAQEEDGGGARSRTRYEITEAGRAQLARWLRESEPDPPKIEAEVVLRAFLADLAGVDDLRRSLDATRRQCAEQAATAVPIFEQYAGSDPPFPERAHLNVLFMHFMAGYLEHLVDWCDDVEAELSHWDSTSGVGMTPRIRAIFDGAVARHLAIVDRHLPEGGPK